MTGKPIGAVEGETRDLDTLLKAIAQRAELLAAGLDPSTSNFRYAEDIRRAALSGVRHADPPSRLDKSERASVLVVEDEPGIREFISVVLMRAGYEVIPASGPRAALDVLRRHPAISLMLVDIVMPEMDGYEVAAEARRIAPGVHVVFVSAFAPDPARQPGDRFLAKPFSSTSLVDLVLRELST